MKDSREDIARKQQEWQEGTVKKALDRLGAKESPNQFYTPLDVPDFDFLGKVGFPGEYPFTSSTFPVNARPVPERAASDEDTAGKSEAPGVRMRAGRYSGYGAPEDTRDYYLQMQGLGRGTGPNLAFDLPTQCGLDSDNPMAAGEVGRVGVAVDSLRDFEVIYEAFEGDNDIDKISSNYTINAPASVITAMYFALANKRGISLSKLRATPQNDILKEFIARGTYVFPPGHSMRLVRDFYTFCVEEAPNLNIASIGGYHIREAGATREQDLGFSMANGIAYLRVGVEAGLDIDLFAPRITFNAFGGSVEMLKEVAFQRAARRMWAKVIRERFGAKNPRSCLLRQGLGPHMGYKDATVNRPLNNLTRAVIGGIASTLSGCPPNAEPPWDEALGLGWSLEAIQLARDATRIMLHEALLTDVIDPLAGSYYIESLTDKMEADAWAIVDKIEAMGGAVVACENGYMHHEVARSAYERQRRVESGETSVVGVNCFVGENEMEVTTTRDVPHPYDPDRREMAESQQLQHLREVRQRRDGKEVAAALNKVKEIAQKEETNLMPPIIQAVGAYATVGEVCDVLREVFGEFQPVAM
ncbi:MAG: methylmalonyl-CoA mutase family protein [Dehalococcoidia bacterium]|jgi:methylmalonyl-CoA mutase N-terminal domain/subunit|nr:methylmalonyl-CoA mutase family protein [Dehalococcoidia bacterium]